MNFHQLVSISHFQKRISNCRIHAFKWFMSAYSLVAIYSLVSFVLFCFSLSYSSMHRKIFPHHINSDQIPCFSRVKNDNSTWRFQTHSSTSQHLLDIRLKNFVRRAMIVCSWHPLLDFPFFLFSLLFLFLLLRLYSSVLMG